MGRSFAASHPSQLANAARSGIDSAPEGWAEANEGTGLMSRRVAPAAWAAAAAVGVMGSRSSFADSRAGPRRLASPSLSK